MKKRIKKILKWTIWFTVLGITIPILGFFVLYSWCCLWPCYIDYDLSVFDESGQPVAHAILTQQYSAALNLYASIFPSAYMAQKQTDANGKFKGRIWTLGRGGAEVLIEKSGFLTTRPFQQPRCDAIIGRTVLFPSSYHLTDFGIEGKNIGESRLSSPCKSFSIPRVEIGYPIGDERGIIKCWGDGVFQYMDKLTEGKLSIPELLKRISKLPEEEKTRLAKLIDYVKSMEVNVTENHVCQEK